MTKRTIAAGPLPSPPAAAPSTDDLLAELRAQQAELERQNEELRLAQSALEQSRDRYRDLYEFAPVGYLTLTRSGLVAEANITAATLLGVEREQLRDQRFDLFVAPADRERWLHKFSAVMARGGLQAFEMALRGEDAASDDAPGGAGCQVQVACLRVDAGTPPDAGGTHAGRRSLRVTLIDISEKKRLGDELDQYRSHLDTLVQRRTADLSAARDAAEVANRDKSSFLTQLSHALRTPMNSILGLAHVLRRSGVSAQQTEKLDKIDRSGRQLTGLINGMLDLARIDGGRIALEPSDFRPAELMRSLDAEIGAAIRAKGLDFSIDLGALPPLLRGDVARLAQALLNYLANACRFTERGAVALSARVVEDGDDACLVRFAVSDSGVGLSSEQQRALFQPYAMDAAGVAPPAEAEAASVGSGLGLALTRHVALLMGGEVGVDSAPGQGSTFWLTVRLDKVGAAAAGERVAGGSVAAAAKVSCEERVRREHAGARILLVEDDPTTQEVMRLLLDDAGLRPDLAGNGVEAVQLAQQNDYALILMDLQMPRMSGLEAARAIRAWPGRQSTPIVALTANVFDEDRRACLAAGMNDFVAKPAAPEQLFAVLLRWLDLVR